MPQSLLKYGIKKKRSAKQAEHLESVCTTTAQSFKENHPPTPSASFRRPKNPSLRTPDGQSITLSAHLKTEALLKTTQNLLFDAEMRADQANERANMEEAKTIALGE